MHLQITAKCINFVSFLKLDDGSCLSDIEEIWAYFVDYLSKIFSTSNPYIDDDMNCRNSIVCVEENLLLNQIPGECEIFRALSQLGPNIALSPNKTTNIF